MLSVGYPGVNARVNKGLGKGWLGVRVRYNPRFITLQDMFSSVFFLLTSLT